MPTKLRSYVAPLVAFLAGLALASGLHDRDSQRELDRARQRGFGEGLDACGRPSRPERIAKWMAR